MKKKLLIFTGTIIEVRDSEIYTKPQFVKYFNELKEFYDITWITNEKNTSVFNTSIKNINVKSFKKRSFKIHLVFYQLYYLYKIFLTDKILIFLPGGFMLFPLLFLNIFFKNKIFTYIGVDFSNQIFSNKIFLQKLWKLSLISLLKNSKGTICRGKYLMKMVSSKVGRFNSINTIPLAVFDDNFIHSAISIQNKFRLNTILFVGQVKKSKGIFILLDVLKKINNPNSKLIIVGTGPDLNSALSYSKKTGISDRVNFAGWIDKPSELSSIYSKATFLIQPSIEPEGVPRTIDESIYYNTPVIATKVGGVNDEFSDEIIKVSPDNIYEIVDQLNIYLNSFIMYERLFKLFEERRNFITKSSPAFQHMNFFKHNK